MKNELTSPLTSLSSSLLVEETPPVSSSAASFAEDTPFLLDDASAVGCSELEPAANDELVPEPPAPIIFMKTLKLC